jgi:PAS domain S-box-containing protein
MPQPPAPTVHWTLASALVGLLYVAFGWLGIFLTVPPGLAAPLYPPAGVALAFVLVFGWRVLPAVAVAAFVVNAFVTSDRGLTLVQWWVPICIGLGAAAQAGVGLWCVQRWVRQPLVLSEPRDIGLFFLLGGALACAINASVATLTLLAAGVLSASSWPLLWATWWMGDTLGVLVAAPIALTLIGCPRADWAPRRLPVGLSLLVALILLAVGIRQTARDDALHAKHFFDADAARVQTAFTAALKEPWHAVQSVAAFYRMARGDATTEADTVLNPVAHQEVTRPWLKGAATALALAWAEPPRGDALTPDMSAADASLPLRFVQISPAATGNAIEWAEGSNLLSSPAAREALNQVLLTGELAVSLIPANELPPGTVKDGRPIAAARVAALLMQPVFVGEPLTPQQRSQSLRGVVVGGFDVDSLLAGAVRQESPALRACLVMDHGTLGAAVAPLSACDEAQSAELRTTLAVEGAPRGLQLRVFANASDLPHTSHFGPRALAVVGLSAVAMLGGLLLTVTGRARRIQLAVADRTSELLQQIKEREATEAQLRESETRLTNIVNNLPLGVVYSNLKGEVKQVNTRFCDLLGYSADELMQMSARHYTHPDDAALDEDGLAQLVSERIPVFSLRKRLVRKNGSLLWVQSTVSLLRDAQGHPRRVVAAVEDVTEHLRLAEAERAREAAEASNQAKSVFLSRMSHELRTPLNAMLGFAQLLELDNRQPLPDAQRGWVAQIQKAGWHLLDMINDVMDLSRIESGNLRLQETTLDLCELLAGTLPLVEADARRRAVSVTHDIAPEAGWVRGDATRVKQILTNLLSNAVKYNVEGGRIHVASRAAEGMVELSVTDSGLGLSADQMKELFQPFNRLGRDRSSIEGTGIGLVISQRLAEWMGGSLRVQSAPGQGSCFTLTLPRVERHESVHGELDEPVATLSTYHRRRVHYVEDNETNVEVMRGILAQRPQIELSVSLTGLDGLAAIRTLRPDVILLDMHLPDISGMELLRHLRSEGATASIPVVVVSADALQAQLDEALQLGAVRYLTKPVNVSDLLSILDDILMGTDTVFGDGII